MLNRQRFRDLRPIASAGLLLPKQPATVTNDVVLSREEWKKNSTFHRLMKQHVLEHRHLGIDKLAASIVRHWSTNHSGRFFDYSPTGELHLMTVPDNIYQRVYTIMKSIVPELDDVTSVTSPAVVGLTARNISPAASIDTMAPTPIPNPLPINMMLSIPTSASPFNHSLEDIADSPKDPSELLPFVPEDIFESIAQPNLQVLPISPDKNEQRRQSPCTLPRRVSLNMKPLDENAECMENLEFQGLSIKKRRAPTAGTSDDSDAAETSPSASLESKADDEEEATREPSSLPLRKRFRKTVSFESSIDELPSTAAAVNPASEAHTIAGTPKSKRALAAQLGYNPRDVVFAGQSVRDHRGNLLLAQSIKRFTKHMRHGDSDDDDSAAEVSSTATRIVCLWKELNARFLEPSNKISGSALKTPSQDGDDGKEEAQSYWTEVEPSVIHQRISIMIRTSLYIQNRPASPPLFSNNNSIATIYEHRVPILHVDVDDCTISHGTRCILIQANTDDQINLSSNDLLLGGKGSDTHLGNLKFLHHIDGEIVLKFERTKSMDSKLEQIRKLIGTWKQCCANKEGQPESAPVRFFVPVDTGSGEDTAENPLIYSSTTDELTIFLHLVRVMKNHLPLIPLGGVRDIYLGDGWTIHRWKRRNVKYCNHVKDSLQAYEVLVNAGTYEKKQFAVREIAIVNGIILDMLKGHASAREPFKSFDRISSTWKPISFDDTRKRTLITLRLKTHFAKNQATNFKVIVDKAASKSLLLQVKGPTSSGWERSSTFVQTPFHKMRGTNMIQSNHASTVTPPIPVGRFNDFVERPGAKSPIPSALQEAMNSSLTDPTLELLEEILLSPKSSNTEKESALLQANIMSPTISPTKAFINKVPLASADFGIHPITFMQPVAKRAAYQSRPNAPACFMPQHTPSAIFRRPPAAAWVPLGRMPSLVPPPVQSSMAYGQQSVPLQPRPSLIHLQQYQQQQHLMHQHHLQQQHLQQQHLQRQRLVQHQANPQKDENGRMTFWVPITVPVEQPNTI